MPRIEPPAVIARGKACARPELRVRPELRTRPESRPQVSDPESPRYGRHLSNDAVNAMVAPTRESVASVLSHLASAGAATTATTPNADMLEAVLSVGAAEALLGCEYYEWRHAASGETALRAARYSLPRSLAPAVAAVAPTVMLHTPGASRGPRRVTVARPDAFINTPKTLRAMYGIDSTQGDPTKAAGNKQAVTAFLGQRYCPSDFAGFQSKFLNASALGYNLSTAQLTLKGDDGGKFFLGGTEAMLDAEYITAMGSNIDTEFWGFAGKDSPPQALWVKMMAAIANASDAEVPKVFSTSYGEDEPFIAADFAARLNVEYMKAGARGISLLFSSGDNGGAGEDPKSKGCPGRKFVPKWPTASPYVTSVGGTSSVGPFQTAASLSSGGFSDRWARPKWQDGAVTAYLADPALSASLKAHINNSAGRAFPDISAEASSWVFADHLPIPVEGTSISSPVVAGVVGVLNGLRLGAGKSSLGFLNPLIYGRMAKAFNDITSGSGDGCHSDDGKGFPAVKGWDAVTGVGSPNFPRLAAVVNELP